MHKVIPLTHWMLYRNGSTTPEEVVVPHDAMLAEPRSPEAVTGNAGSYFPGGSYRYEYELEVPASWEGKVATLELEGVYQKATVLVDGTEVARNAYGYTGFFVDLTAQLHPGTTSTITVVADNTRQPNSRWYSGSGIYRPTRLHVQELDRIAPNGIRVTTLSTNPARVRVQTEVIGAGTPMVELWDPDADTCVAHGKGADVTLEVPGARLWSAEDPALYDCRVTLAQGGRTLDEQRLNVGIRTIEWGAFGLRVNGREALLKGGCVHHTKGVLGAAEPSEAAWREVALLKSHGFNAIRSAHNPISCAMLDACDHLGVYVMDELCDMWYRHKNPADYAEDFERSWEADLAAMVAKDQPHPSVIMYSIGNENAEPAEARGVDTVHLLATHTRELDPTRPVTAGVNPAILFAASLGIESFNGDGEEGESAAPEAGSATEANASLVFNTYAAKMGDVMALMCRLPQVGRANAPFLAELDIAGYNYGTPRYLPDIHRHPERPVVGAETMPYDIGRNWELVERTPQIIGDFMWSAIDYLGECSLAGWSDDPQMVNKPYPWLCADTGALDLIGNPNGEMAMAELAWGVRDLALYVRPCTLPHPVRAPWRKTDSIPSWSWRGCEGIWTSVEVFSRAPVVKLVLNGRTLNAKNPRGGLASFRVRYEPGTLEAIACTAQGEMLAQTQLTSAEGPLHLELTPEPRHAPELSDPAGDLVFVDVSVCDSVGTIESSLSCEVSVEVEGGDLVAFGSAAQKSERSYLEGTFPLRYGRALAVVRPATACCVLRATCPGLSPTELAL